MKNILLIDFTEKELLENINRTRSWYWGSPERHRQGRKDLIGTRHKIVGLSLQGLEIFDGEIAFDLADSYSALRDAKIRLFQHAIEALEELYSLYSLDVRLGLVTNGTATEQRSKINRFGLGRFFEVCLIEGETGYGKPDLLVYRRALRELDLDAGEVWMVGDNLIWDVVVPQKLGIYSIWNDYKHIGLPEDTEIIPDNIIHDIYELLSMV